MRAQRFGFLLVPGFAMMPFTSAVEPLRSANRLSGRQLYEWWIVTPDGRPMPASSGIEIVAQSGIDDLPRLDYLFVVAGIDAHSFVDKRVFACLRRRR